MKPATQVQINVCAEKEPISSSYTIRHRLLPLPHLIHRLALEDVLDSGSIDLRAYK